MRVALFCGILFAAVLANPALAQQGSKDESLQASIAELKRQIRTQSKAIEVLQRRVEELEGLPETKPLARRRIVAVPAAREADRSPLVAPDAPRQAAVIPPVPAGVASAPTPVASTAGRLPPEPMGEDFEDALLQSLNSNLPGFSFRVPGTGSEVRFYGFGKALGYHDFDGRNQTDIPAPQSIPLAGSPADIQGGDFGTSSRFSRLGVFTNTLLSWGGTLQTRIEGDFAGGDASADDANAPFRLRQAWALWGTDTFRVLFGWANSLWNDGWYETLNDAVNLNQSFVRQPEARAIVGITPELTGQVSLETPDTQYTSVAGIFTPTTSLNGGLSPAFTSLPDLLGELTYQNNGLTLDMRGLLRELTIRTAGTAASPPELTRNTPGWGLLADARIPMRSLSEVFGADELIGMGYYGQGIGRYFSGNTSGQDALSNIGLPGTSTSFSLDALPTYGTTIAYRRFWTPQLRSNLEYSWAWQDYPSYALLFTPGSPSATSLNSEMQEAIVNLIWSPYAQLHDGKVSTGWLDVGIEYMYTTRNVLGGSAATGTAGAGNGVANRIVAAAIGHF